jgi:exonuclease SbcC
MTPISLTMQAFGPYRQETTVDFSKLGSSLFLIEGPTGAGKSTIFDAMCYALYGDEGMKRKGKELRNQKASPSEMTYVEFVFDHQGKTYKVRRKPEQERQALRGNKTTTEKASLEVYVDDKPRGGNIRENGDFLKDILGLTAEQFRMVVLIPQGDFAKLVTADSSTRQTLFRKIFMTDDLQRFALTLQDEAKKATHEVENDESTIRTRLQGYAFLPEEEKSPLKASLTDDPAVLFGHIDETMSLLRENLGKRKEDLEGSKKALAELEKKSQDAQRKAEQAKEHNKRLSAFSEHKAKLEALDSKKDEAEKKRETLKAADSARLLKTQIDGRDLAAKEAGDAKAALDKSETEIKAAQDRAGKAMEALKGKPALEKKRDELVSKKSTLTVLLEKANSLAKAEGERKAAERLVSSAASKLTEANDKLNALGKEKDGIDKRLSSDTISDRDKKLSDEMAALKGKEKDLSNLGKSLEELKGKDIEIQELTDATKAALQKKTDAEARHFNALTLYNEEAAYRLGMSLKEGDPCPVCGSPSHPKKAAEPEKYVDEGTLKRLEATKDQLTAAYNEADKARAAAVSSREGTAKEAIRLFESLGVKGIDEERFLDSYSGLQTSLSLERDRLSQEEQAILKEKAAREHDRKRKDEIAKEESALKSSVASLTEAKERALRDESAKENAVASLKKELGGQDQKSILEAIKKVDQETSDASKKINALENEGKEAESALQSALSRKEERKSAKEKADAKLSKLRDDLKKAIQASPFADEAAVLKAYLGDTERDALSAEIDAYSQELSKAKALFDQDIKDGVDSFAPEDEASLLAAAAECAQEASAAGQEVGKMAATIKANESLLDDVMKSLGDSRAKIKHAEDLRELSNVANGAEGVGKYNRLAFETYYQQRFFREILEVASQRFFKMSDGAYEFAIRDSSSGAAQGGLDIDVFSYEAGKARAASTLSGGETFMASLSLALALSDVISRRHGGFDLGCLFIDEGFGSLDDEKLTNVVNILNGLSTESRSMVGVISHVDALAGAIDKQVEVKRGENGDSYITMRL